MIIKVFKMFYRILCLKLKIQNKHTQLRILYEKHRKNAPLKVLARALDCSLGSIHNKINGKTVLREHEFEILLNFYKLLELEQRN